MKEGPVRILYIDDDPILARLAQRALGRLGYEVLHAEDIERGRALFAEAGFDAVVLDHFLQSGTGLSLLRELVDAPGAVPVVYVTGSNDAQVAVEALKAGAVDTLLVARPLIENNPDDAESLVRLALAQGADVEEIGNDVGVRLWQDAEGVAARLRFKLVA